MSFFFHTVLYVREIHLVFLYSSFPMLLLIVISCPHQSPNHYQSTPPKSASFKLLLEGHNHRYTTLKNSVFHDSYFLSIVKKMSIRCQGALSSSDINLSVLHFLKLWTKIIWGWHLSFMHSINHKKIAPWACNCTCAEKWVGLEENNRSIIVCVLSVVQVGTSISCSKS